MYFIAKVHQCKTETNKISEEKILELAIKAGADECISTNDIHEIFCNKEELYKVKKISF